MNTKYINCNFRAPNHNGKIGLGLGIDFKWGKKIELKVNYDKYLTEDLRNFILKYKSYFDHIFLSFQAKNKNKLSSKEYIKTYKEIFSLFDNVKYRSLHHTMLNLGTTENYYKNNLIDFTNELIDSLNLQWIHEDVGIWSIGGKSIPHPLPPIFTYEGFKLCVQNINEYQKNLIAPLVIEFPYFADGMSFYIGAMDPFEYFRNLALETSSPVALDIGNILGCLCVSGKDLNDFYEDILKLPLENCIEIHLSGSAVLKGKFLDLHHGILLDEQFKVLDLLLEKCPNLKVITYEDPKFLNDGSLVVNTINSFNKIKSRTKKWMESNEKNDNRISCL